MNSLYQDLLFPLNVYAALLDHEYDAADSLHYGIFIHQGEGILQAQQNATNLLLAQLPKPGSSVLEVGTGFGTTLNHLLENGYDAFGINPDAAQVDLAMQRFDFAEQRLICTGFEDLTVDDASLQSIFFQESAQYIDPVLLVQKCADLLEENGTVVIMDEFVLNCGGRIQGQLHQLTTFLAHAARCRFVVRRHDDLTKQAIGTLNYLVERLDRLQSILTQQLDLDGQAIPSLLRELRQYQRRYMDGRYGYVLLCLEKIQQCRYTIYPAKKEDRAAISVLFKDVFSQPLSPEEHHWKYGNGRGRAMLAWDENRLVGHYGGLVRDVLYKGQRDQALQVCDVMVTAAHRERKGPFWLTASALVESYVGACTEYLLAFGFPNKRAMRLGKLLGLYDEVGSLCQLEWQPASRSFPSPLTTLVPLHAENYDTFALGIDLLWRDMEQGFFENIIGIRDSTYVKRRYLEHPVHDYQVIAVCTRLTRKMKGLMVLKEHGEALLLVDCVAPIERLPLIIKEARRITAIQNKTRLFFWITANYASELHWGAEKNISLDITIPLNASVHEPTVAEVKDRWWLTAGDTDLL